MSTLLAFLGSKGVELNADHTAATSNDKQSTLITPLIHQRALKITGPDTEKFLQGQLTCDVRDVFTRGSSLGAHCNIKGHMLSLFRIIRLSQESVWLRMHHEIFDTATQQLKKYMVFSKAEAEDVSNSVAGIGISGPGAQAFIENTFGSCPSEDNGILSLTHGVVIRVPGERYEIWQSEDALVELLKKLPDEIGYGSTDTWILSEIDAGIPDLRSQTQEAFIPQMTNFQALEGVSFKKGCYTGQEVVTRLQHRGILKKPMYIAEVTAETRPEAGDKIVNAQKEVVGTIVLAAPTKETPNTYRLLAVINKRAADEHPTDLSLENDRNSLQLLVLPYLLDPKLFERK